MKNNSILKKNSEINNKMNLDTQELIQRVNDVISKRDVQEAAWSLNFKDKK